VVNFRTKRGQNTISVRSAVMACCVVDMLLGRIVCVVYQKDCCVNCVSDVETNQAWLIVS
jgi:hypothetical protein